MIKTVLKVSALALFLMAMILVTSNRTSANNSLVAAPGEDEVKESIKKRFDQTYFNSTARNVYNVVSVEYEFGVMKIGSLVKKQMGRGEEARDVYPVRVKVTVKQTRKEGEVRTTERGVDGETFYFFKDGFDEWDFRNGR